MTPSISSLWHWRSGKKRNTRFQEIADCVSHLMVAHCLPLLKLRVTILYHTSHRQALKLKGHIPSLSASSSIALPVAPSGSSGSVALARSPSAFVIIATSALASYTKFYERVCNVLRKEKTLGVRVHYICVHMMLSDRRECPLFGSQCQAELKDAE